jgi:hypothetical protein
MKMMGKKYHTFFFIIHTYMFSVFTIFKYYCLLLIEVPNHFTEELTILHAGILEFSPFIIPVRIRVTIDPPHPLVCCKRRLNGAVLQMRPEKLRPCVTAGVAR